MQLKKKGKKDGEPTELVRYDVYLHKRRDAKLEEHLKPFRDLRSTNAEMRRMMYVCLEVEAGSTPRAAQPVAPLPAANTGADLLDPIEDEPADTKTRMKRMFG